MCYSQELDFDSSEMGAEFSRRRIQFDFLF